jgi:hypothetical protein
VARCHPINPSLNDNFKVEKHTAFVLNRKTPGIEHMLEEKILILPSMLSEQMLTLCMKESNIDCQIGAENWYHCSANDKNDITMNII